MSSAPPDPWTHEHVYLGEGHDANERRTWIVVALTGAMMVLEIAAGAAFNSMALLADGWHMATHAGALGISALAYRYARRHARDPRFTFGTGKVGDLAGYTSAVVLGGIALLIAWEAVARLRAPLPISFDEALAVASLGLAVNLASAAVLAAGGHAHGHAHDHAHGGDHAHDREHDRDRDRDRDREHGREHDRDREHDRADAARPSAAVHPERGAAAGGAESKGHDHRHARVHSHADHNLRAAYLHVLADALTSVLAIVALAFGRYLGAGWMDPAMGLVGALVIARWSVLLLRDTGRVLLDVATEDGVARALRGAVAARGGDRVSDLHLWRVGPGHVAAIVSVVTERGSSPEEIRAVLAAVPGVAHLTVEVRRA